MVGCYSRVPRLSSAQDFGAVGVVGRQSDDAAAVAEAQPLAFPATQH